ncbi:MAG TPA: 4-hydroxy-3-methylbut-2-enyl diphosphate reductase [Phycisphaerae bacterium]|nr:4-hydroxy-3-methylbut-2-enyl diphosphate reductase [Phycisphaerae bacterium]
MTATRTGIHAIVAKPRGFCAGVERAVRVVELALEQYGPPVYVRKQIVHNLHVVERLRARGAVFVEELSEVPRGAIAVLSAHGSAPQVYGQAGALDLRLIDATCPLVTKVHGEARRYVKQGYRIILIGHAGHDEVIGTMGQAPDRTVLVETLDDVARLELAQNEPGVILTQTTLSQDDTQALVDALRRRFPHLELPPSEDICYATQNRQNAIKQVAGGLDLLLVVGSQNSSNSQRLTEVARARGVTAHLIEDAGQINPGWLAGVACVGVSSGASVPDDLVQEVLVRLRRLGVTSWEEIDAPDEGVVFNLPPFTQLTRAGRGV